MNIKHKSITYFIALNLLGPQIASVQNDLKNWGVGSRNAIRARIAQTWGYAELSKPAYEPARTYTADNLDEMTARALIVDIARSEQVPPALALAVATRESRFKPYAVSSRSAFGIMQIHISNLKVCGFSNPAQMFEPVPNIKCGIKILKAALKSNPKNIPNALREYNGGSKCVKLKCSESEAYVKAIMPKILEEITS